MASLAEQLQTLRQAPNLAGLGHITRGLEKESLRVTPKGTLAQTPHPKALGSALTHPLITTDYSEALLEFITPPSQSISTLLDTLSQLHQFTYQHIGDELLWSNSMPCLLGHDHEIPIARYGSSNIGQMKSIYREGLGHRYGRAMQTIAGTHYNFSVSDTLWQFLHQQDQSPLRLEAYKTERYMGLIRNFRRYFWLLLYLFGATPAVCSSFVQHRAHQLVPVGDGSTTLHTPYATALRMGDLGYQSKAQESLVINYNDLGSYIDTLCQAITQTHPHYAAIGIQDNSGHYRQLNNSLLQIENEFYSVVRPKRSIHSGQTALSALSEGGIEYIEVRCLDLNPFEPLGITAQQVRFLDCFLLFCLLEDSPLSNDEEYRHLQINQHRMVYQGRDPELSLYHRGQQRPIREWGTQLIRQLQTIAQVLDSEDQQTPAYQEAVAMEARKLADDRLTPSSRVLASIQAHQQSFFYATQAATEKNRQVFTDNADQAPLSTAQLAHFEQLAQESQQKQQQIEDSDTLTLAAFLRDYYEQYQCCNHNTVMAI